MSSTSRPERRPLDLTEVTRVASARNVYVTLATVGVAIHAGAALGGRSSHFIDDWLYCGLYLLAAASCAYRVRRGDAGGAWGVAAGGVLVWGSAEVLFRITAANPRSWYPDEAQALLFIGFSLAYCTLGLLARERI